MLYLRNVRHVVMSTQFGIALLPLLVSLSTGCSFGTEFVVVNKSNGSVEVRYKAKKASGERPLSCKTPSIMAVSKLNASNETWQELSESEYKLDADKGTTTVSIKPDYALRIMSIIRPDNDQEEFFEREHFCADEISITGPNGEIRFEGKQVYKAFLSESSALRTLTYY